MSGLSHNSSADALLIFGQEALIRATKENAQKLPEEKSDSVRAVDHFKLAEYVVKILTLTMPVVALNASCRLHADCIQADMRKSQGQRNLEEIYLALMLPACRQAAVEQAALLDRSPEQQTVAEGDPGPAHALHRSHSCRFRSANMLTS